MISSPLVLNQGVMNTFWSVLCWGGRGGFPRQVEWKVQQ